MAKKKLKTTLKRLGLIVCLYLLYVLTTGIVAFILKTPPERVERNLSFEETTERVTLLEDGLDAFDARLGLIEEAKESIDVSYFYMKDGESVQLFYAYILAAADRGVKVRYLLDGVFHGVRGDDRDVMFLFNEHPNITFKLYEPLSSVWYAPWRLNNRMHDKLLIIDEQYAISGGRNIGDGYFEQRDPDIEYSYDRDVLLFNSEREEHGLVNQLKNYYDQIWHSEFTVTQKNSPLIRNDFQDKNVKLKNLYTLHRIEANQQEETLALRRWRDRSVEIDRGYVTHNSIKRNYKQPYVWSDMLTLTEEATESIVIQSPWVVPDRHMRNEIAQLNLSIEKGTLITNGMSTNSNLFAQSGTENRKHEFINSFLDYYEFQPNGSSLHMKTWIFDEHIVAIGAFNFDARSAYFSTESMLVIESEALASEILSEIRDRYIPDSVRFDADGKIIPEERESPIWWQRLLIPALRPLARVVESLL